MFVVVLARGVPSPSDPMLGDFEFAQARALVAEGHRVVVCAIDVRSARFPRRHGVYRSTVDGLDVVVASLPLGSVGPKLTAALLTDGWRRSLRLIVANFGVPDVVHAHFHRCGVAAARVRAEVDYALVVTEHNWTLDLESVSLTQLELAREAYAGADAVLAVSPTLVEQIRQVFGFESICVPSVHDMAEFTAVRPKAHSGTRLVSVGSLEVVKRMELLVDTYAVALAKSDVTLTIIGGGPLRARIAQRIAELNLPQVNLVGRLTRQQIADEFAVSDGFVLLSERETFGVALVEAMASGLPVLSSLSGGPSAYVTPEVGMLVGTAERAKLALGLRDFVQALPSYNRSVIRAAWARQFAPQVIARQLSDVYGQVLARRQPTGESSRSD